MPFFFHAGECLGTGNSTDHNLFDAILLGTRRIGHGFSLYKHPLLIDLVKEKKILVESCPISNEVLRLCGSVMSHPLPALLARGVAVSDSITILLFLSISNTPLPLPCPSSPFLFLFIHSFSSYYASISHLPHGTAVPDSFSPLPGKPTQYLSPGKKNTRTIPPCHTVPNCGRFPSFTL